MLCFLFLAGNVLELLMLISTIQIGKGRTKTQLRGSRMSFELVNFFQLMITSINELIVLMQTTYTNISKSSYKEISLLYVYEQLYEK